MLHDRAFHRNIYITGKLMAVWLVLTHWGRVTHTYVTKLTIIGSNSGLSPGLRRAIIWTNAGMLLTGQLGTNFSEMLIEICFHSRKCIWKCRQEIVGHFASVGFDVLKHIRMVSFCEIIFFRDNIVQLDIYFSGLKYESIQQIKAYETMNFLSTYI